MVYQRSLPSGRGTRVAPAAPVAVAVPVVVMLALGLWGLDRGGTWRDEDVTLQVARRSVPQIWRLLHGVDAVHGLYYLLMHPVLAVRADEVALRLPSVGAAAATAGLIAALGVRLARPRVGLWAGLLYAATPLAGHYAQEGRSYALVGAGATAATLLLVRALDGRRSWWPYGVVVTLTCLLHELAVPALLAHAVTLAHARVARRTWRGWAGAAGAALAALLPLALVSRAQAGQIAWLPRPGPGSAERLLRAFLGQGGPVLWACLLLAAVAVPPRSRRAPSVTSVALPLMALPPLALLAVSQVRPMYDDRYVLYALAGAPLLVAAGADRLLRAAGAVLPGPGSAPCRAGSPLVPLAGTLAVALAFTHQLPLHRQDRTLLTRPDSLAAVSALAARELRPGDAVVFLPSIGRRAALSHPEGFRGVRDIALRTPGPASGTLYGRETGARELRRRLLTLDRLWLVAEPYALRSPWYPRNPTERVKLTVVGERFVPYEPRREFVRDGVMLRLYAKRRPEGARVPTGTTGPRVPTGTRAPRPAPRTRARPPVPPRPAPPRPAPR
ncbi:glycosyltransferase family 39 protein [Streptomyces phaeofaciens JCM 4814]|uniref:Mannosyltransferase n=1 Tax=Streptomyces phaeofaciens TaxID=68254 RepID=A0A918H8U2_9ACTN|nr:glycosyltransferase family 39 protein [Streptomyces phaeofaciens]GGT42977.1 mannosyltransferase [Streptomyces phaeofaciens]